MTPTIRDVAEAAQTSIKTVSRVINDEPGVSPEVRQRVKRVIEQVGYVPNISARRLKRGRSEALALALPRVESPYAMRLLSCALREARKRGFSILIIEGDVMLDRSKGLIQRAVKLRQVDGLILAPPLLACPDVLAYLNEINFPYVVITPNQLDCVNYSVEVADREGSAEATRYLLSLGHRRIAYLTCGTDFRFSQERLAGFQQEMEQAGVALDQSLIFDGDTTFESGYRIARKLLESVELPSAILAGNDEMAVGAINQLYLSGISVPRDISVMGFDDMPIAQQVAPPLTTVCQPVDQIVEKAVELLVRVICDPEPPEHQHIQIPTRLVLRRTCGRPRGASD